MYSVYLFTYPHTSPHTNSCRHVTMSHTIDAMKYIISFTQFTLGRNSHQKLTSTCSRLHCRQMIPCNYRTTPSNYKQPPEKNIEAEFYVPGKTLGKSPVSTMTRIYMQSSLTNPPLTSCSCLMNIGQPEAMFISRLPGRWKLLE